MKINPKSLLGNVIAVTLYWTFFAAINRFSLTGAIGSVLIVLGIRLYLDSRSRDH